MRCSAAGWLADTEEECISLAEATAKPTHDHPEGVKGAVSLPAAVLVSCVNLTLASLCVALKKKKLLGAIKITSMLGAGLAVLPILIHEANVMLLPNVVVPIALMAVFFDVYAMTNRKEAKEGQPTGKTL